MDGIPEGVSVERELEVQKLIPDIARSEGGGWNGQGDGLGATRQTGAVQRAGLSQVKVGGGVTPLYQVLLTGQAR